MMMRMMRWTTKRDNVRPSDDVTPELETVIDLIEQLRQNRADEE